MGHRRLATPDLGRIFQGDAVAGLSEWELLDRYLERRDEVAFEALVARHGPMVLAVCRRMLTGQTDVEDAFQATFLVLVRRARQLGPRDAIGPWLYGVATRVACGRDRKRPAATESSPFPRILRRSLMNTAAAPPIVRSARSSTRSSPACRPSIGIPLYFAISRARRMNRRPGSSSGRSEP